MPRFATESASFRPDTQDRALVLPIEAGWIVGVADGTGGISGGAEAADLFVAGVRRAALSNFRITSPAAWVALLEALDQEIASEPAAGESTGVALSVSSGLVVGASCGDSRAYLFTSSGCRELTSQQSRRPRLGSGQATARPFMADARGILVVGTDGLFDYVKVEEISSVVLTASDRAADALVRLVLERYPSPPDDIAVVVGWLD